MEEFVSAVEELYPDVLVQWEDFRKDNAFDLLARYRERLLSFNDDIQGTGAVALAGLLAAAKAGGRPLDRQRVLIVGAGAAGVGIAHQLRTALSERGVEGERLERAVALSDSRGLLVEDRQGLEAYKRPVAWSRELVASLGAGEERELESLVAKIRPTVLIGTSGQPETFTAAIVRTLLEEVERPVIFPFSNPTENSEARPQDLLGWSGGRALVATGSPFPPVTLDGRTFRIGQGNNAFIFPAIGLAALVAGARRVSDGALSAAAEALADQVSERELETGQLFPNISRLREVTAAVAAKVVARIGHEDGGRRLVPEDIAAAIGDAMWEPEYPELIPIDRS